MRRSDCPVPIGPAGGRKPGQFGGGIGVALASSVGSARGSAGLGLELAQAYEACRQETAQWAKTFYLGTLLMPPAKRRAIWAIYVWCRRTDELMDSAEAQQRPVRELSERLDAWEGRTRRLLTARSLMTWTG